jgi:hypothetical protein
MTKKIGRVISENEEKYEERYTTETERDTEDPADAYQQKNLMKMRQVEFPEPMEIN